MLATNPSKGNARKRHPLCDLEVAVFILNGEGIYSSEFEYARLAQMRTIHRVGRVERPVRNISMPPSSADLPLIHTALDVSRRRTERHLAPWDVYLKALPTLHSTLRDYVDSYIAAGSSYERWAKENPRLVNRLEFDLGAMKPRLSRTSTGGASLELESRQRDRPIVNARQEAAYVFGVLLTSAPAAILECPRCARYFLNRTGRDGRKYCKRECALYATATEATKRAREKQHNEELQAARRAIQSWSRQGAAGQWKPWVASHAGLTLTFLTRAINSNQLKSPAEPRRKSQRKRGK